MGCPPLPILLGAIVIAKEYDVKDMVAMMLPKVKARVKAENFNEVCGCAIAHDIAPLRFFCVLFAKENEQDIKRLWSSGALSPEVVFELNAIWELEQPQSPVVKRVK